MLANGTVYPEATVEARRYRFRILNACQARFLNLQLYVDDGSADGITLNANLAPTNPKGPDFLVIGTEGGFLWAPTTVKSNVSVRSGDAQGQPDHRAGRTLGPDRRLQGVRGQEDHPLQRRAGAVPDG